MIDGNAERRSNCKDCGRPAAGEGENCIFCGATLMLRPVHCWRSVYHPYSYADGLLCNATLQAHGVTVRLKHSNIERVFMGHIGSVVEVAEGQHLYAQEVLRQLRGVRTDTEYLEWQELKHRTCRRRALFGTVAAATATAALAASLLLGLLGDDRLAAQTSKEHASR
jgi:hypothetical protein